MALSAPIDEERASTAPNGGLGVGTQVVSPVPAEDRHQSSNASVGSSAESTQGDVSLRTTSKVADVPGRMARKATATPAPRAVRLRRARGRGSWDADEVAAHLMGRQKQIVRGLARRSPWVGLDDETLASCFGHGAATIARVAASGSRPDWRTTEHLEKAQVAAYRHQALDHWRRINTQSREGERSTVRFNAELHATSDAPLERLFDQPDLHAIERDLLAEIGDEELRAFWWIVLREQLSFKEAGDALGLTKAEVMARTRAGRSTFARYLDRRATGALCAERGLDIAEERVGTATPLRAERALAHLESCYACALVHEPSTSALRRGILGIAPTGLVLRLVARIGDAASSPVMRIADSGSGSRAVAAGLAAVAVAGSGVGIKAATTTPDAPAKPALRAPAAPSPPAASRSLPSAVSAARARTGSVTSKPRASRKRPSNSRRKASGPTSRQAPGRSPSPSFSAPASVAAREFDFEQSAATPSPRPTRVPAAPPTNEFDLP